MYLNRVQVFRSLVPRGIAPGTQPGRFIFIRSRIVEFLFRLLFHAPGTRFSVPFLEFVLIFLPFFPILFSLPYLRDEIIFMFRYCELITFFASSFCPPKSLLSSSYIMRFSYFVIDILIIGDWKVRWKYYIFIIIYRCVRRGRKYLKIFVINNILWYNYGICNYLSIRSRKELFLNNLHLYRMDRN